MKDKEVEELNKERLKNIADGSAFPMSTPLTNYFGMTRREHIATQCLAALITARPNEIDTDLLSGIAIQYADKLIEKLHTNLDK